MELIIDLASQFRWKLDDKNPVDQFAGWTILRFRRDILDGTPTTLYAKMDGSMVHLHYYHVYGPGIAVDLCDPLSLAKIRSFFVGHWSSFLFKPFITSWPVAMLVMVAMVLVTHVIYVVTMP
jgi:hypothetical protein